MHDVAPKCRMISTRLLPLDHYLQSRHYCHRVIITTTARRWQWWITLFLLLFFSYRRNDIIVRVSSFAHKARRIVAERDVSRFSYGDNRDRSANWKIMLQSKDAPVKKLLLQLSASRDGSSTNIGLQTPQVCYSSASSRQVRIRVEETEWLQIWY
jgi:hypothetical protein